MSEVRFRLVVAGVGGQGILFATHLLEQAALGRGLPVLGAETHGMSQRGGSVLSHFKVGPFRGPLVRRGSADCLLGMTLDEAWRHAAYLRPGGFAVLNCDESALDGSPVAGRLREQGVEVWAESADAVAMRLGMPTLANVALLGCALAHPDFPFRLEEVRAAVEARSPARFLEPNLQALEEGHRLGTARAARRGGKPGAGRAAR
jgi:indolepyruvate ferredoxin oxidoreductase beta subunit